MQLRNKLHIDDVSQFSNNDEVALAVVGRYGKYQDHTYNLTIIKDIVFVHSWADCIVELPAHYDFKFTDAAGEHIVNESTNTIEVKGITSFSFVYKNK